MMTLKLQIVLLILFLVFLVHMIRTMRSRKLDIAYSIPWVLLDVVLILLTLFPRLLDAMAQTLGIYSATNMIFFCGFLFSLLIIYMLTVAISKLKREVKRLAQSIALMDAQLRKSEHTEHQS